MDFRSLARNNGLWLALILAASITAFWIVPFAGLCGLILSLLLLVARYDNSSGTFLPLAVLSLIAVGTMALLLFGMAVIHALMSGGG